MCLSNVGLIVWYVILFTTKGSSLPWPDFETGWLPITNGLENVARINIDHGLGETPVLVDVSVKIEDHIFQASGFRPDHPTEHSGPVVYIYDDMYVNVSASPNVDPLYRIFPRVPNSYAGSNNLVVMGAVHVRVWAWKQSTLPPSDFKDHNIKLKSNTSKAIDSYAERFHNLNEMPCLVVVRMKMQLDGNTIMADGVGSSMQVFHDIKDRTNAYLVYGYSNTSFRMWVDSSFDGAIFDGRKHTWFDFVIAEGGAELYAWKCSTLTPKHYARVVTSNTMDNVPSWWNVIEDYHMEHSLIRVMVQAEHSDGANEGYRFPGSMHLGYLGYTQSSGMNSATQPVIGGLTYTYETRWKFNFWQPIFGNGSSIFIAESFGSGTNSEASNSESVYIHSWIYEENGGCKEPVIHHGSADMLTNDTSVGANATVRCDEGYLLKPREKYYISDFEEKRITCTQFGYWSNMPSCLHEEQEVDAICNPAGDTCRDQHAICTLAPDEKVYRCLCNEGYRKANSRCIVLGQYLPNPDFNSGWKYLSRLSSDKWYYNWEHGLGAVPLIVDVQIKIDGYIFPALGFRPDQRLRNGNNGAVVYIYDERFINVSTSKSENYNRDNLISEIGYKWYGYQNSYGYLGYVRARAWKSESLPSPDVEDNTRVLRANTSRANDSFYELKHNLDEHPSLVLVRAKMIHDGKTFYANGVGSALNVFKDVINMTNAFLVYGYSDSSVRTWVDSSKDGAIFDGRKYTRFDFVVSEAVVEIYAWKFSTLTPFFTYTFSLDDDKFPYSVKFAVNFKQDESFTTAVTEIDDPAAQNTGFRFPGSTFMADRDTYDPVSNVTDCIFGGFMYGYRPNYFSMFRLETTTELLLYKPVNYTFPNRDTGSLVCIPKSFGSGEHSEKAFNGVGLLYSWIYPDCGIPEKDHAYINTSISGTEYGAIPTITCDEGFRLSQKNAVPRCGADNKWIIYTSCRPVECNAIEPPLNGTMNITGQTFGNNITFKCVVGFTLNGDDTLECLSSGNWSGTVPSCDIVECGTAVAPSNGVKNATGKTFGHNITFQCNTGYVLNGNTMMDCLHSGQWSGSTPACELIQDSISIQSMAIVIGCVIVGVVIIAIVIGVAMYYRRSTYSVVVQGQK